MVLYGTSSIAAHSKGILIDINKYRKDYGKALCDVTLKVGESEINAHKNILSASSQYFSSLFCGSYRDSLDSKVDLSAVTTDSETIEAVINFIYIGEIEINEQNVGVIVKLATYFVVEQLLKFCSQFLQETLNKDTCLRYYILSYNHGLADVEDKSAAVLKSRIHDHLIYTDDMLDLKPPDLDLIASKGFFKHCLLDRIVCFLAKWIEEGQNEESIVTANKVMKNAVNNSESKEHDKNDDDKSDYNASLKNLEACGVEVDLSEKMEEPGKSRSSNAVSETQDVVLTISPKRIVVEKSKEILKTAAYSPDFPRSFAEDIFDLCLYIPSQKQWHHLQNIEDKSVFKKLVRHGELYIWRYVCMKHHLYMAIGGETSPLYVYNLQDFSLRKIQYYHLMDNLEDDDNYSEYCGDVWLTVYDDELYLILNIVCRTVNDEEEGFEVTHNFNICYKLDQGDNSLNWQFVCRTPKFPTSEEEGHISGLLHDGEMVILFTGAFEGLIYYCIVDLNKSPPEILLKNPKEADLDVYEWPHFLTKRQQVYFESEDSSSLEDETVFTCHTLHESKSKKLTSCRSMQIKMGKNGRGKCISPCGYQLAANDGKCIWNFYGSPLNDRSELSEVSLGDNGCLGKKEHTPPPFSSITAAAAGQLDISKLKLTPITQYIL